MTIIGVDASNLRAGGGVTHLKEVLTFANPEEVGVEKIIVWGGQATLNLLPDRDWIDLRTEKALNLPQPHRFLWQLVTLSKRASENCDILFVPGGIYLGSFRPYVAMSQTMLPYDFDAIRKYGVSLITLKTLFIRLTQIITFKRAEGIIFLNKFAQEKIHQYVNLSRPKTRIIPHGIHKRFYKPPADQRNIQDYSFQKPIKLLYVSHIEQYKHQWHVIEAVAKLRRKEIPIKLILAGAISNAKTLLKESLDRFDPQEDFVDILGKIPFSEMDKIYHQADLFIFASSVENLPITLLEAMASGLPIACSNREPMPSVLGDAGFYFDPEDPDEIHKVIEELLLAPNLRKQFAQKGFQRAQAYSWERCAHDTISFLKEIAASESN